MWTSVAPVRGVRDVATARTVHVADAVALAVGLVDVDVVAAGALRQDVVVRVGIGTVVEDRHDIDPGHTWALHARNGAHAQPATVVGGKRVVIANGSINELGHFII